MGASARGGARSRCSPLAPPASRPLPQTRVETLSPRGSRPVQVRSGAWIPPSLARSCPERRGSAPGSVPLVGAEARRLRAASGVGEARPSGSRRQPGSPPATLLCSGGGWGAGRAGGCGRGPWRPLVPAPARHEPRPLAHAVRAVGTGRIAVVTGRVCPKQRPGPPFGQFPLQDSQNHFGGSLSATRRGPPRFLLGPCAAAVCPPASHLRREHRCRAGPARAWVLPGSRSSPITNTGRSLSVA